MMTRRAGIVGLCIAILAAALLLWQFGPWRAKPAATASAGAVVPVRVAVTRKQDAPIYLSTIATVQAFNMVTVRSRVDGEISRIAFREGQLVHHGDILVELDRRPFEAQLRGAVGQRDKDKALLDNAKIDLARYTTLAETGSAPAQTRDTTRSLVNQLEASLEADEALIDVAKLQIVYSTIRAPIDGRVGARLVDAGNVVHPADTTGLVVLTQVHPISVSFALPQAALPVLRAQQAQHPLRVTAQAQEAKAPPDEGELVFIDNQIDPATDTIRCKATFANRADALWPGQFVTARVLLQNVKDAVLVPTVAIQAGGRGPYVYVVRDGVAKLRQISTGQGMGDDTTVLNGLTGGESVVVEGQFQLEPDARVAVKPADSPGASPK